MEQLKNHMAFDFQLLNWNVIGYLIFIRYTFSQTFNCYVLKHLAIPHVLRMFFEKKKKKVLVQR